MVGSPRASHDVSAAGDFLLKLLFLTFFYFFRELEKGNAEPDIADDSRFDPMEQSPLLPTLPGECQKMLPLLWASKSASALKKWPILKLLWKAAPRKCHSKDVESMVANIAASSKSMAASIHAIHKASLLGNYA